MSRRGFFLTIEGVEGAGKTAAMHVVDQWFQDRGYTTRRVREPGGTPVGEKLRTVFLDAQKDGSSSLTADILMLVTAKHLLYHQVIRPAILRGEVVIADRWTDTLYAYQGGGFGAKAETIDQALAVADVQYMPNVTFFLDVQPEIGLMRTRGRDTNNALDSFSPLFFAKVNEVFRQRMRSPMHFTRMHGIDANQPIEDVHRDIGRMLQKTAGVLLNEPVMA